MKYRITAYQQQYADNQNISFLPAIVSTSTRMHGEFLHLLFLQAHRETEAHFTAAGCHRKPTTRKSDIILQDLLQAVRVETSRLSVDKAR